MTDKYAAPAELPRYPTIIRDADEAPLEQHSDMAADIPRHGDPDGTGLPFTPPPPKFPSMSDVTIPFAEARARERAEKEARVAAANSAEAALPLKADEHDFNERRRGSAIPMAYHGGDNRLYASMEHRDDDEEDDLVDDEDIVVHGDTGDHTITDQAPYTGQSYSALRDPLASDHDSDVFQRVESEHFKEKSADDIWNSRKQQDYDSAVRRDGTHPSQTTSDRLADASWIGGASLHPVTSGGSHQRPAEPYMARDKDDDHIDDDDDDYREEVVHVTRSGPSQDVDYIEEEVVEDYDDDNKDYLSSHHGSHPQRDSGHHIAALPVPVHSSPSHVLPSEVEGANQSVNPMVEPQLPATGSLSSEEHTRDINDELDRGRSSSTSGLDSRVKRRGALVSAADRESAPMITDQNIASGDASWIGGGSRKLVPASDRNIDESVSSTHMDDDSNKAPWIAASRQSDLSEVIDDDVDGNTYHDHRRGYALGAAATASVVGTAAAATTNALGTSSTEEVAREHATPFVEESDEPEWVRNHGNLLSASNEPDLSPPTVSSSYPVVEGPSMADDSLQGVPSEPEWARKSPLMPMNDNNWQGQSDRAAVVGQMDDDETPDWVRNRPALTPVSSIPADNAVNEVPTFVRDSSLHGQDGFDEHPHVVGADSGIGLYDSRVSDAQDVVPAVDLRAPSHEDLRENVDLYDERHDPDHLDYADARDSEYPTPVVAAAASSGDHVNGARTINDYDEEHSRSLPVSAMVASTAVAAAAVPSYSSLQDGSATSEPPLFASTSSYGALQPVPTRDEPVYSDEKPFTERETFSESISAPSYERHHEPSVHSDYSHVALGGSGPLSAMASQDLYTSESRSLESGKLFTKGVDMPSVAVVSGASILKPDNALFDDDADDSTPDADVAKRHSEMLAASSDPNATHVNVTRDFALVGGHAVGVNDAAFFDAETLVTAGQDGKVCVWDLDRRCVKSEFIPYEGAPVSMLHVIPNNHSSHPIVMTLSNSRQMRIWSIVGDRAVLLRTMQIPVAKNDLVMSVPVVTPELMERAVRSASIASAASASALPMNETHTTDIAKPVPDYTEEEYGEDYGYADETVPELPVPTGEIPARRKIGHSVMGRRKAAVPA